MQLRSGSAGEADDLCGAAPQILEPVVLALLGAEEVDDDVAEVEEHPATGWCAFVTAEIVPLWFELVFQVLGERVKLQRRLGRRDDEVVCEGRRFGDVHQGDVQRLVVTQDINSLVGEKFGTQRALLHFFANHTSWQGL